MALSAWPDLWSVAHAERDPADARATLLLVHAEQFVAAPTRDRQAVESFEAIALGFVPHVTQAVLVDVARLVVPCSDTPVTVLDALAQRFPETREIVLDLAPRLPPTVVDLLLGSSRDRLALAARPDLYDATLERLLVLHDPAIDQALAANLALLPSDEGFSQLIERGRNNPALARTLLSRSDLPVADQASLYLFADSERRALIRSQVAASALFQRPHLPFRLTPARVDELLAAAGRGDITAFESHLTACFGLPSRVAWTLLETSRRELLALGLRALGVEEEDATRIFLTLHPAISHSVETVFALVRILRTVARPTALALIEAVLAERTAFAPAGRHHPAMDPSGTPAAAPQAQRSQRRSDELQRRRG
jgi:hypothetical protein